jgi:hypothetical protein
MNKYLVQIRIKSQVVKTVIYADSTIHAKLLGEWHYGIGSVASTPTQIKEQATVKPIKPLTPQQARVKALQGQVEKARQAVKVERAKQAMTKATQQKPTL